MLLSDFRVAQPDASADFVPLYCQDRQQTVAAAIGRMCLEKYFHRRKLTGIQAGALVRANQDALARIISAKYERGEYQAHAYAGSMIRRVGIELPDIEESGEVLTDSVLDDQAGWAMPDGRWSHGPASRDMSPLPETAEAHSRGCNCSVVREESGKPRTGRDGGTRYAIEKGCPVHG